MKKLLSILLALALPCFASAQTDLAPAETPAVQAVGMEFACDVFSVALPFGYAALSEAELAGYEAAVESDYPGAAETLLVTANIDGTASVCFSITQSAQDPLEAAQEAALNILGSAENASECSFGDNRCGYFACTADELTFETLFLSNGSALLTICACNMPQAELAAMMESLNFAQAAVTQ